MPMPGPQAIAQPLYKFYGEQSPLHGGILHWPGIGGLPFRTQGQSPPTVGPEDYPRIYVARDACHALLDLSNEKDAKIYCWIRDRIRNGWFVLDYIERQWDPQANRMLIYIEWTQLYAQLHSRQ